jgi:hypothetical protein
VVWAWIQWPRKGSSQGVLWARLRTFEWQRASDILNSWTTIGFPKGRSCNVDVVKTYQLLRGGAMSEGLLKIGWNNKWGSGIYVDPILPKYYLTFVYVTFKLNSLFYESSINKFLGDTTFKKIKIPSSVRLCVTKCCYNERNLQGFPY